MKFGNRLHLALAAYHKDQIDICDEDLQAFLNEYKTIYDFEYQVVEEFWSVSLFDTAIQLRTKVDLIKDDFLIDHKTSSRPYTQDLIDSQLQVTAYAYSWHQKFDEPEQGIKFNVFNTNPKPGQELLQVLETHRTQEHFDEWEEWVRKILDGIENNRFEPNPQAKWHNFPGCEFYKEREVIE